MAKKQKLQQTVPIKKGKTKHPRPSTGQSKKPPKK